MIILKSNFVILGWLGLYWLKNKRSMSNEVTRKNKNQNSITDYPFMLQRDGIVHLNSSSSKKNIIVLLTCGQLDAFWANLQACCKKIQNLSRREKCFSLEKHAILFLHRKIHRLNTKRLMISHTQFQINCNYNYNTGQLFSICWGPPRTLVSSQMRRRRIIFDHLARSIRSHSKRSLISFLLRLKIFWSIR